MTAVAVELLPAPPMPTDVPSADTPAALDPDTIEYVADTDRLMTMCNCSASSDNPY